MGRRLRREIRIRIVCRWGGVAGVWVKALEAGYGGWVAGGWELVGKAGSGAVGGFTDRLLVRIGVVQCQFSIQLIQLQTAATFVMLWSYAGIDSKLPLLFLACCFDSARYC